MGWRDLTYDQREALYQRKQSGEDILLLAQEVGAKVETLSRHLRRHAQVKQGGVSPSVDKATGVQVTVKDRGNTREILTLGTRITNLDQLLEYCGVDQGVWVVEKHEINKWEATRKGVRKDLKFASGKVDGFIEDTGGFTVEPMFQIRVTLLKKRPEPIQPVIQPVNINIKFPRPIQRVRGMRSALILPDPQFGFSRNIHSGRLLPFHDRTALDVVRQVAEVIEPDVSVFLGDVNDFSAWSDKYIRRPEFYFTTQPSLIESAWYIGLIHRLTIGDTYVIDGNHDIRPDTQIIKHVMEAYQLRSADNLDASPVLGIDNLLGLTRMGVQYVQGYPDGEVWLNDFTKIIHGAKVRGGPGQTASAVVRDANETTIFGHIHRRELATRTVRTRDGYRAITAYSPGCLCHIDGRVPGSSKDTQWQQGAAVVWFDGEDSTITPIDIFNGRAVYEGELYQGKDYVEELKSDTDWNF